MATHHPVLKLRCSALATLFLPFVVLKRLPKKVCNEFATRIFVGQPKASCGGSACVCEPYVHARRVACYTYITDDMKDAVRMPMRGRSDPERRRQGHQKPRFRDRRTRTPCMHAGHD